MNAVLDVFRDLRQPMLQDALNDALRDGAISETRVPRVRAAVAAFARLMHRPATELHAHQGFIIQQMRRLRRQPTGLSAKTLSNSRSELLHLVKVFRGRGPRSALPLTDEWARFRASLERGPASPSGSSLTAASTSPQDALRAKIERRSRRSQPTS